MGVTTWDSFVTDTFSCISCMTRQPFSTKTYHFRYDNGAFSHNKKSCQLWKGKLFHSQNKKFISGLTRQPFLTKENMLYTEFQQQLHLFSELPFLRSVNESNYYHKQQQFTYFYRYPGIQSQMKTITLVAKNCNLYLHHEKLLLKVHRTYQTPKPNNKAILIFFPHKFQCFSNLNMMHITPRTKQ